MHGGYRILPSIYDRWQKTYGKDFSALILPHLLSTLRSHRIGDSGLERSGRTSSDTAYPLTMVDVACGTGTMALLMARRGWEVFGIDASEGMISEAVRKSSGIGLPVHFLHQDMRSFTLPSRVTLATSFFDSLNHLLGEEDLLATFKRVHASLLPGGWFVFDVNNEACFATLWTKSETVDHRDFTLILECSYDRRERIAVCEVTLKRKHEGNETALSEIVRERLYAPEEITTSLFQAGFEIRESIDFNFTSNPAMGKIKTWWVAKKMNSEADLN
jgi:SAM-dependent methyltransferase